MSAVVVGGDGCVRLQAFTLTHDGICAILTAQDWTRKKFARPSLPKVRGAVFFGELEAGIAQLADFELGVCVLFFFSLFFRDGP